MRGDGPGPAAPDVEVLVVGGGPAGLTVAHELVRRGIRPRVVDRAPGPATTSRALATHPRTMEVFHQMGLVDELLARGQRVEHFTLHMRGRPLIRFDTNYGKLPTRYPYTLMVDQVLTEEVLRDGLRRLGVEVEWGTELVDFAPGLQQVTARLRSTGAEAAQEVTAGWLVGADGSRSTVRERLGLRLHGGAARTWLNADVVLDAPLPRDSNHLVHTGQGTLLLVPFPAPGKWRIVDTEYAEDTVDAGDPEAVRALLSRKLEKALGQPVAVSAPTWISVFRVQQRMITAMRSGRCFVAGDAAHVHSPASGQGMNTGIQDAYNLAWKLADVVRGHARDALLDTYPAERLPVGGRLLGSTRKATALVALRNAAAPVLMPVGLTALKALRPAKRRVEHRMMAGMSGLALHYEDGPLTPRPAAGAMDGVRPGRRVGCSADEEKRHPGWRALCQELTDPRWTLLLFGDGQRCAERVDGAYGGAVSVRVVTSGSAGGDGPYALADPDGAVGRALGPGPGAYALIRPDGYLADRGPLAGFAGIAAVFDGFHLLPGDERAGE
ncbi:FAD-dependent oxidoreductase [Streptomyces sp. NPDC050617]|uniref:FAD-dependent oxidoreductase n=1 Tax=Streptomyces sp. NPDC050617 TaxID=3154628 RepID=UPI00341DDE4C